MNTEAKILEFIRKRVNVRVEDIKQEFWLSRVSIHKYLIKLQRSKQIIKSGSSPKVFYSILEENSEKCSPFILSDSIKKEIEFNYLYISPTGQFLPGVKGFEYWCKKTKQDITKTANDYISTLKKYYHFKKDGLIDGTEKIKKTFSDIGLDKIFYLDFYSIDRFGKTKLGQMLLYAKQSQNEKLIYELVEEIDSKINFFVKKYNITSVGFIPPTVKRELQLMRVLERSLNLNLKNINLEKIKNKFIVPQKTLFKLEDRIENARETIIVDGNNKHKNILLIDDAVGSGATLNETALQIRKKKICTGKIYGLAIVGSFKGFDVISEV
ncbi:MAG: hypothetical protein AAB872_01475 [Patescibacteria group bacterium]